MSLLTAEEIRQSPLYDQMFRSRIQMTPQKRAETQNKDSELNWRFPFGSEREYSVWIDKEFRENIVEPVNQYVLDNYLLWLEEFKKDSVHWIEHLLPAHTEKNTTEILDKKKKRYDDLHKDGLLDIFTGIKNAVQKAFSSFARVVKVGNDIDNFNEKEWDRFVKEATGVNLRLFDSQAQTFVQEWVDLNTTFLSNLPDEYVNNIFNIVSQGVVDGVSKTVIAQQIGDAGKKFRGVFGEDNIQKRSERIARDQTGKLNSALSRSRMKQAKVDIYKWSTSADERVRGTPGGKYPKSKFSHFIMNRKFKQVDNSRKISDNGTDWRNVRGREEPRHAGQAINCRCTMIPSFIKMKKIVDNDIKKAAA